jgi:hypothetical protein
MRRPEIHGGFESVLLRGLAWLLGASMTAVVAHGIVDFVDSLSARASDAYGERAHTALGPVAVIALILACGIVARAVAIRLGRADRIDPFVALGRSLSPAGTLLSCIAVGSRQTPPAPTASACSSRWKSPNSSPRSDTSRGSTTRSAGTSRSASRSSSWSPRSSRLWAFVSRAWRWTRVSRRRNRSSRGYRSRDPLWPYLWPRTRARSSIAGTPPSRPSSLEPPAFAHLLRRSSSGRRLLRRQYSSSRVEGKSMVSNRRARFSRC